jgi:hypothetical protein
MKDNGEATRVISKAWKERFGAIASWAVILVWLAFLIPHHPDGAASPPEAVDVVAAPDNSASTAPETVADESEDSAPAVAENGSYYGEISAVNGLPRTHLVSGYYRRDGTYVRGYYRSN